MKNDQDKIPKNRKPKTKTQSNQILKTTLLTQSRVQQLQNSFTENL